MEEEKDAVTRCLEIIQEGETVYEISGLNSAQPSQEDVIWIGIIVVQDYPLRTENMGSHYNSFGK